MLGLLAVPLVAEAQPGKVFRVGFLTAFASNADAPLFDSFRQGMRELGYEEGRKRSCRTMNPCGALCGGLYEHSFIYWPTQRSGQ